MAMVKDGWCCKSNHFGSWATVVEYETTPMLDVPAEGLQGWVAMYR